MECPICHNELPEEELLEGVGPCWACKETIDQEDIEKEINNEYSG